MIRVWLVLGFCAAAATARAEELRPRTNVVRVEHQTLLGNPSLGPAHAPVTAELFLVPGQAESNRAYRRLLELHERHPRRLRVVFRVITRHAQVVVPIASLEAYAQGKFDAFMEAVLTAKGAVRRDHLAKIADEAGLDPVRLERALDRAQDPELPAPLRENERRRQRRGGANVPELLFNGVPVKQPLPALDVDELERYYDDAYAEAVQLMDDGVPVERIVEATERRTALPHAIGFWPAGQVDDPEPGFTPPEGAPPLAKRALDLTGLPTLGPDDARLEVVVLCNLRYVSCRQQVEAVGKKLQDLYADDLRLVWYPWYDPRVEGNEDAPALHAAAICAEAQGAGWKWIDETLRQVVRGAGEGDIDRLIDDVAERAGVDRARLDACLASGAVAAADARVADAMAAGVHHGPAFVIGGRVFIGGFDDWRVAAPFVDGELAPGLLEQLVPHWTDP